MADAPGNWTAQIPLWGAILAGASVAAAWARDKFTTGARLSVVETKVDGLANTAEEAADVSQANAVAIARVETKVDSLIDEIRRRGAD